MYCAELKLITGATDILYFQPPTMIDAVERVLLTNAWVKCEETDTYFNMNNVVSFKIKEQ